MSVEHGHMPELHKENAVGKTWDKLKHMVMYIPSLIGGILGFAKEKQQTH